MPDMTLTERSIPAAATPQRLTPCIGCGTPVEYRTNSKVYCLPCRSAKKRENYRATAERKRRKNGIQAVESVIPCARCGVDIVRRGIKRQYCKPCAAKAVVERRNERWAKNPSLALNGRVSVAIGFSLKGTKAGRSWEALVGYTLHDLMRHLERQFVGTKMTWANRGVFWELDHVRPVASFNITGPDCDAFRECWSLANLRPLPKSANRKKKDKRLFLL
jgi:hypothetical protein